MPVALLAALLGSLAIHAAALFGTDIELFGGAQDPPPLRAELRPPPAPPAAAAPEQVPAKPATKPAKSPRPPAAKPVPNAVTVAAPAELDASSNADSATKTAPEMPSTATRPPAAPARPALPAVGYIRFLIYKGSLGLQIGRAEHRWEFSGDGRYRLKATTETSGLAALFKPIRMETESRGLLAAGGLQPESYRSLKNGGDNNENADFDWSTEQVTLARDGSVRPIAPGTQDILSLNYQLAYLGKLAEGSEIGVVTGKKYERYAIDSLGEEEIETPAGRFRTLHLRAMTDNITEIWIALDRQYLPVKIRFTDRKGDSYEQVVSEIGTPSPN
jgi:hypothetical protein